MFRSRKGVKCLHKRLVEEEPTVLIQDWFKDSQTRNRVMKAITDTLDKELPESYSRNIFQEKSNRIYELIYSYSAGRMDNNVKAAYCSN